MGIKALIGGVAIGGALIGGVLIGGPASEAASAPVTVGHRDHSHAGTTAPTAEKPQSKLWFHAGTWWGVLFRPSAHGGRFTIHRLDRPSQRWIDTGVAVDTRENVHLDALSHGDQLYVASSRGSANPSLDRKVRIWGYTYKAASRTYTVDRGFPVAIADGEVEAVVIDRDSTGTLWATFVLNGHVMVTHTRGAVTTWVAPYVLPVGPAANVRPEPEGDQSALVASGGNQIGIMFSSQVDPTGVGVMYWATHTDGTGDRSWVLTRAYAGQKLADEHINLKALPNHDRAGLVLAAVKTSLRGGREEQEAVHLLRLRADGTWTSHQFGTVAENHTRPLVQVDIDHRKVYVFAVSPCCRGDVIYMKVSSLDALSFPPGRGTPFIESPADVNLNNPTGTKQLVGSASGLLVLVGDDVTHTYLHNYKSLTPAPPPSPATRAAGTKGRSGRVEASPAAAPAAARPSQSVAGADGGVQVAEVTPPPRQDPVVLPTTLTRQVYFGWFAAFLAFTGIDVVVLLNAAAAALFLGIALVAVARGRRRRAPATTALTYAPTPTGAGVQT